MLANEEWNIGTRDDSIYRYCVGCKYLKSFGLSSLICDNHEDSINLSVSGKKSCYTPNKEVDVGIRAN